MNQCESCVRAIKKMCLREVSLLRDYQPIEYVLMNSGSYLNTGVSLPNGAIGEMKIEILSGALSNSSGTKDNTTTKYNRNYFNFFYDSSLKRYVIGIGAGGFNAAWTDYTFNKIYTVSYNTPDHSYVLNGTSYTYTSNWSDAQNPPYSKWDWILHGAPGADGSISANAGASKIYYYRLCDHNGVLKRDLHPMIRKSDNVVGMYDLVSGTFFTNAGTGDFLAPIIPDDYQPVEYIVLGSGAYMDTGVSLTSGAIGLMKFNILSGNLGHGAGSKDDTTSKYNRNYFNVWYDSGPKKYVFGMGAGGYNGSWPTANLNTVYTVTYDTPKHTAVINGTDYNFNNYNWMDAKNPPYSRWNWVLHASVNASNGSYTGATGEVVLYYYNLCDHNGMLKRWMYPVVRKSDSVAGMYDLISGTLFTNAGTGEFTAGPNI